MSVLLLTHIQKISNSIEKLFKLDVYLQKGWSIKIVFTVSLSGNTVKDIICKMFLTKNVLTNSPLTASNLWV